MVTNSCIEMACDDVWWLCVVVGVRYEVVVCVDLLAFNWFV